MKRFGITLIAAVLAVLMLGTIAASAAITIGQDWYLNEQFNKENNKGFQMVSVKVNNNDLNLGLRKTTDPYQEYKMGTLMVVKPAGNNTSGIHVKLHTTANRSGTPATNYGSAWFQGLLNGVNDKGYIATSYFFGEPNSDPIANGSGILRYGETVDTTQTKYKYVYEGARFYEQSFYVSSITRRAFEMKPLLTLASDPTTEINPGELHFKISSGVPYVNDVQIPGVADFEAGTSADRKWRQLKWVYDFVANEAYLYLDGVRVSTYAPENDQILFVRRLDLVLGGGISMVLDDYVSDPHGGAALTPFFTDFYQDGLKIKNTAAGDIKAKVLLYKDIPSEYKILAGVFDKDGMLKSTQVLSEADADTVDKSLTVNFTNVAATDELLVMAVDGFDTMTPLCDARRLQPASE